eukprot:455156-Rhodomonas_salina.3
MRQAFLSAAQPSGLVSPGNRTAFVLENEGRFYHARDPNTLSSQKGKRATLSAWNHHLACQAQTLHIIQSPRSKCTGPTCRRQRASPPLLAPDPCPMLRPTRASMLASVDADSPSLRSGSVSVRHLTRNTSRKVRSVPNVSISRPCLRAAFQ